jgi:4-azaleucine resistance transporter AzlC
MSDELALQRSELRTKALSIGLAVAPFGLAFGVLCGQAGLSVWQAAGFSALVFTGSAQFAAVTVLKEGGGVSTAIATALLISIRFVAYGVVMAPHMPVRRWRRALESHLMIDESMAIGTAAQSPKLVRYGYLAGGLSVFVLWNLTTLLGIAIGGGAQDSIHRLGIDAAIPASFLFLVWPRLQDRAQRPVVLLGALITLVLIPIAPPGVPILAAAAASLIAFRPGQALSNTQGHDSGLVEQDRLPI